ncbi:hypothetical protein NIES4072_28480 [Nostoc commune NIES-4072]|uniref:Uncharacterized protein n=1 Tax=Nostoc commune NIES-4072 TaxID=2005467 RepID=A0A2R5FTN6_NOSCO|nr:hypothetical protein NIES4070_62270 [Nostoc commune HK-02]GBG19181.1 hypothetical protein NIES4072_28480 [Nostoc commune NIES-4072]
MEIIIISNKSFIGKMKNWVKQEQELKVEIQSFLTVLFHLISLRVIIMTGLLSLITN